MTLIISSNDRWPRTRAQHIFCEEWLMGPQWRKGAPFSNIFLKVYERGTFWPKLVLHPTKSPLLDIWVWIVCWEHSASFHASFWLSLQIFPTIVFDWKNKLRKNVFLNPALFYLSGLLKPITSRQLISELKLKLRNAKIDCEINFAVYESFFKTCPRFVLNNFNGLEYFLSEKLGFFCIKDWFQLQGFILEIRFWKMWLKS